MFVLPREIETFLREPGRSLVVKGAAGAGKTLFSIALARWFQVELGDVFWMNARDAEPAVVAELDEFVPPDARIDASTLAAAAEGAATASPLALLDDLRKEFVRGERALVVIDSVSALTGDVDAAERSAFERGITRLARATGANLVLIVESVESEPIEYLADGVVSLGEDETPVGRVRVLRPRKLRGAPAALARHPFTLTDGEFWTPEGGAPALAEPALRAPARPDARDRVSTGTLSWDLLLDGGLRRGSVSLLETPRAVGFHENALVVPLMLNALVLGRDATTLLTAGESRSAFERWILPHLPPAPKGRLDVMEAGELVMEPKFGDEGASLDERMTRFERLRARSAGPVVSALSLDALATAASQEALGVWLARWTFQTHRAGHVDVLVARPDQAALATSVADAHWRLDLWEGHLVARGLSPSTEPFFVRFHALRGFPETELRRIQ